MSTILDQLQQQNHMVVVHTAKTEIDNQFNVYWASGVKKQGKIVVTVDSILKDEKDARIVAELSALHDLLDTKAVLGDVAGKDCTVVVSSGAIRKLMLRAGQVDVDSPKDYLGRYATALLIRFPEADFVTSQDTSWMRKDIETVRTSTLQVDGPCLHLMEFPPYGKVAVQIHAFRRFCQRCNVATLSDAWHLMRKMIQSGDCKPYGPAESKEGERWRHRDGWVMVFDNQPVRRLVTMYYA